MDKVIQPFGDLGVKPKSRIKKLLHNETNSGALLLIAAAIAMLVANSPFSDWYFDLASTNIGPAFLHLDLSIQKWSADGLLAIFFFVAGMELKYELTFGSLSNKANAAVPIAAALGGMIAPALIFYGFNFDSTSAQGWGIPMATDIAFALAVLGIAGRKLPIELRAFLLSLAVVDDLGAIIVIAIFYTSQLAILQLIIGVLCLVGFALGQKYQLKNQVIFIFLALASWYFIHESGVHATIAGIALGLAMRVHPNASEQQSPLERALDKFHPWSAGLCVPLFAFFAAGISLSNFSVSAAIESTVSLGILFGLILGKPIGIFGFAWLATKFTKAQLNSSLYWGDILALGFLAGIGFTVSLLISQLAFELGSEFNSIARLSVLLASTISAFLAFMLLQMRKRRHS